MGQYNTAIVTQQGQQILAEAVGAQQVITFTSVKTSSHSYSSETDLTTLTGLQDIMQSVSPSSAAVTNGNIVEVTARFDNTGVQNEYQIQTIGLYGKTPNGEETLIAVVKAVTPDTMPNSAYSPIAYIYSIQLTIQSGESVAVTVNPAGTATVQDVFELQQTIATLQQNVNEQIAQLNSDLQIKTYDSPSDLGLQAGRNLHIVDVFKAMPANSIFQCTCEAEATFSISDYPVSQTGSVIGFGVITINKGQGNRNSIIFSQSLSAGTHDLWINSFTYTSDECALSSWNKVTTNADMSNKARGYIDLSGSFIGFSVGDYNPSILINPAENYIRLQFTGSDNQPHIYDYILTPK